MYWSLSCDHGIEYVGVNARRTCSTTREYSVEKVRPRMLQRVILVLVYLIVVYSLVGENEKKKTTWYSFFMWSLYCEAQVQIRNSLRSNNTTTILYYIHLITKDNQPVTSWRLLVQQIFTGV